MPRLIPRELKFFSREWKEEKIKFEEEQRRKEFKKRLVSKEPLLNILLENKFNDIFEEFFIYFLTVADQNFFEKCYDYQEKINRFEEIEKYEKEGKILSEEEKIEKEKLEEQLDNIISEMCNTMELYFREEEAEKKREEQRQRQIELELEKNAENNLESEEDYVDEFELAYKKRKARQKIFDYITWGLFCISLLASLCWMFFWKMGYDEYLIFTSYFWVSIWTVIGINYYKLKDLPIPKFYSGKRYIASIFEKIADLFDKNRDDQYY